MIWKHCILKRERTTDSRLGSKLPTGTFDIITEADCRFTPWSNEDVAVEGRDVTRNEQRYALPIPYDTAKNATHAELDGVLLKVKQVIDLSPRWSLLQVEVHRQ